MKNSKKKNRADPTNFEKVEAKFLSLAEGLTAIDHVEAAEAYDRLAVRTYTYGKAVIQRDIEMGLANYLCRRDRSVAVFKMTVFELAIQLAFPGKFPPLHPQMRKTFATKLSYALLKRVKSDDLVPFLAKLPPAKKMKQELASGTAEQVVETTPVPRPTPASKRPVKRKPKPHRLANSPSHKALKASARAARRSASRSSS